MHFAERPEKINWEILGRNTLYCFYCNYREAEYFCKLSTDGHDEVVKVALCTTCMKLPEIELKSHFFGGGENGESKK